MDLHVKKEIISRLVSIVTTALFLVVITWFWFGPRVELTEAKTALQGKTLSYSNLEFTDLSDGIKLENAYPVTDTKGSSVEPFRFQITNHDSVEATFTIAFFNDLLAVEKDNCKTLDNNYIRYTIEKDGVVSPARNLPLDGSMYIDTLQAGETEVYSLKFWIDYNAGNEIMDTHFHAKVGIVQELSTS